MSGRLIAGRVLLFGVTLLISAGIVFFALRVLPGDVSDVILAESIGTLDAAAQRELIRARLGLDQPLPVQFGGWLLAAARGDLGASFIDGKDVSRIVTERLPWSASLAALVTLLSMLILIPASVVTALAYRTWVDDFVRVVAVLSLSAPNFFIALLLIYVLSMSAGWSSRTPSAVFGTELGGDIQTLLLPVLVQTLGTVAPAIRLMRSQLLGVLQEDYIRTARAKGLNDRTVILVHAIPVAAGPVLAYSGFWFARMLGGLVVIEQLFLIPGVGTKLLQAIVTRDYPVAQGILLFVVGLVSLVNLMIDIAVMWLDPRTRRVT